MQSTIFSLLPPPLRRSATPDRIALVVQFVRFGMVGFTGMIVDTITVYGTRGALGLYGAGLAGYTTSATFNWMLNRLWTFKGRSSGSLHRQWAVFMVANLAGFVLNRGTYALLVTFLEAAQDQPVIAVAAGSMAGMFVNFTLNRRLVFR